MLLTSSELLGYMAFSGIPTLRVTTEVVLSGRHAVSVFTPLGVRNSLSTRRIFILLITAKTQRQVKSDMQ